MAVTKKLLIIKSASTKSKTAKAKTPAAKPATEGKMLLPMRTPESR
jgi:hypothetical protein